MSYNANSLSQQLQDIQSKYQQLSNLQGQAQLFSSPQPSFVQMPQQPIQPRQIQYVEGLNGAVFYQNNLPPNASEIIMDKNEDIFYKVSKDANGIASKKIPIGKFTIVEEQLEEEEPVFLTKKDLDEFKEEMKQLFKNNSVTKEPTKSGGETK